MATQSKPRKLYHKWKYIVEVDGFQSFAFNKASEIKWEAADVDHWEGGNLIPHKEPGRITVPDVTFDRGAGLDRDMHNWAQETADFVKNGGAVPQDMKRNIDIVQHARDGSEEQRITLFNCYVKSYSFGDFDSGSDEIRIEQMVIRYDFPKDQTDT